MPFHDRAPVRLLSATLLAEPSLLFESVSGCLFRPNFAGPGNGFVWWTNHFVPLARRNLFTNPRPPGHCQAWSDRLANQPGLSSDRIDHVHKLLVGNLAQVLSRN